jgi:3D (Asp-Asp-Asp) domain-containing protein
VLVVALGTAGVVAFHPHDSPTVATGALPTEPLPAPATASPTAGDVSVTTGARTASTTPTAISPPASAATTTHPTTAATTTHPAKAATIAASPSTSPAGSAFSAAPAIARTGTIIGAGGLCLDLNGGVAIDGNHVQVFTCNGTDAQRWTLATDGTLRVVGKCAQTIADGTVHITTCNTGAATQWRQGKSRALVNVGTGTCLTDPRSGSQSGSGAQVAACTGAAGQQWSLP